MIETDVCITTTYKRTEGKPKIKFTGILSKIMIGTLILTSLATSTTPVFAATDYSKTTNTIATVTQNYEVSLESAIYNIKETVTAIEQMKAKGTITQEKIETLAKQIVELERAVQVSGIETSKEIIEVIQDVEKVLQGVHGAEKVVVAIQIAKHNLNIEEEVKEVKVDNTKSGVVQLSDIGKHWGKSSIERLVGMKAIAGYPDGTFKPDKTISFAEFLKIAVTSVEKNVKSSEQGSHWASGVYATAIEKGIIKSNEFKGTKERFDSTITREDMALILVRLNEISQGNTKVDTSKAKAMIQDYSKIASNRTYYVEQAYQKGLLKGKGDGFDPKGNLTRAEAATAVINLLDYKEGTVVETPKAVEGQQILRWNDPNRPIAKEGDIFITPDGREVVLKVGPSGVLGEGQGVATEIGRAHPNGKLIKHGDLGSNEKYLGQPYYVFDKTGEGHYQREWDAISTYYRTNILPKVENPQDGQIVDNWFYYEGGQWYWIGASQNSNR